MDRVCACRKKGRTEVFFGTWREVKPKGGEIFWYNGTQGMFGTYEQRASEKSGESGRGCEPWIGKLLPSGKGALNASTRGGWSLLWMKQQLKNFAV